MSDKIEDLFLKFFPLIFSAGVIIIIFVHVMAFFSEDKSCFNSSKIKADLIELVIASDPTLSNEEIKHRVNDLYKFIIEDEK